MVSLGAIIVDSKLDKTYYAEMKPISERFLPEAIAIPGFTREQTMGFGDPKAAMIGFRDWLTTHCKGKPMFISDNNGFDWMFVAWYFHHFLGENPFGFSSMNLSSLYKGLERNVFSNFRHLRVTPHTHHPVDDARGNAEALLSMKKDYKLKIKL